MTRTFTLTEENVEEIVVEELQQYLEMNIDFPDARSSKVIDAVKVILEDYMLAEEYKSYLDFLDDRTETYSFGSS